MTQWMKTVECYCGETMIDELTEKPLVDVTLDDSKWFEQGNKINKVGRANR